MKKPCPDCHVNLIKFKSQRCRSCANLHAWTHIRKKLPKIIYYCCDCNKPVSDKRTKRCKKCRLELIITKCIDCRKRIYKGSTRCQSCATKNLWRNEEFANKMKAKIKALGLKRKIYSSLETRYLEIFANYGFQWQQVIAGHRPDFTNKLYKIIVEIYGDYWHCNPNKYEEDFCHPEIKLTALEIREKDKKRIEDFKNAGYQTHIIWESQLNDINFKINDFLESLNLKSNLLPEYKGLTTQEIIAKIQPNKLPFAVAMEHWQGDFNFSTLCRNGNALGAKEIFYIGRKQWNKKGAVGVQYYSDVKYISSYKEFEKLKNNYVFVGIDNVKGSQSMQNFAWPSNTMMIFGEENKGLTDSMLKLCDYVVNIPMRGTVRSLNAGCASAIAMFSYCLQNNKTR